MSSTAPSLALHYGDNNRNSDSDNDDNSKGMKFSSQLSSFKLMLVKESQYYIDLRQRTYGRGLTAAEMCALQNRCMARYESKKHELALEAWINWKNKMENYRYTVSSIRIIEDQYLADE